MYDTEWCKECVCNKCPYRNTKNCIDTCQLCKLNGIATPNNYCDNDDVMNEK